MASMGGYICHLLRKITSSWWCVMMCAKDSDNIAVAVFCWWLSSVSVTLCCTTLFSGRFHDFILMPFTPQEEPKNATYSSVLLPDVMFPSLLARQLAILLHLRTLGFDVLFLRDLPPDVPDVPLHKALPTERVNHKARRPNDSRLDWTCQSRYAKPQPVTFRNLK